MWLRLLARPDKSVCYGHWTQNRCNWSRGNNSERETRRTNPSCPNSTGGEHRAEVAFRLEESVLYNAIKGALDAFETGEKDSRALFESKITDLIWTVERDRDAVKKTIKQTRNMLAVLELKNYEIMHGSVKQWQAMMADEFLRTSSPAVRKWKKDWLDKLDAQWSGIWGFYDDLKLKNEQFIRNVMQPLEDIETRWAALRAQAMEHVEAEEQKVIAVLEAAHATRVEKLIRDFEAVPVLGLRAVGEYQQQASAIALVKAKKNISDTAEKALKEISDSLELRKQNQERQWISVIAANQKHMQVQELTLRKLLDSNLEALDQAVKRIQEDWITERARMIIEGRLWEDDATKQITAAMEEVFEETRTAPAEATTVPMVVAASGRQGPQSILRGPGDPAPPQRARIRSGVRHDTKEIPRDPLHTKAVFRASVVPFWAGERRQKSYHAPRSTEVLKDYIRSMEEGTAVEYDVYDMGKYWDDDIKHFFEKSGLSREEAIVRIKQKQNEHAASQVPPLPPPHDLAQIADRREEDAQFPYVPIGKYPAPRPRYTALPAAAASPASAPVAAAAPAPVPAAAEAPRRRFIFPGVQEQAPYVPPPPRPMPGTRESYAWPEFSEPRGL